MRKKVPIPKYTPKPDAAKDLGVKRRYASIDEFMNSTRGRLMQGKMPLCPNTSGAELSEPVPRVPMVTPDHKVHDMVYYEVIASPLKPDPIPDDELKFKRHEDSYTNDRQTFAASDDPTIHLSFDIDID